MEPRVVQLDLFEEAGELQQIQRDMDELKAKQDKVRKSLFAKHGELVKGFLELHGSVEALHEGQHKLETMLIKILEKLE